MLYCSFYTVLLLFGGKVYTVSSVSSCTAVHTSHLLQKMTLQLYGTFLCITGLLNRQNTRTSHHLLNMKNANNCTLFIIYATLPIPLHSSSQPCLWIPSDTEKQNRKPSLVSELFLTLSPSSGTPYGEQSGKQNSLWHYADV